VKVTVVRVNRLLGYRQAQAETRPVAAAPFPEGLEQVMRRCAERDRAATASSRITN
jgi:hypothetical protein